MPDIQSIDLAMETVPQPAPRLSYPHEDGIWLVNPRHSEAWEAAHILEETVFKESGYLDEEKNITIESEYGHFEQQSEFIVTLRDNAVVGSLRAISYGVNGFKTIEDIEAEKLDISSQGWELLQRTNLVSHVVEVGTISVHKDHQAKFPSADNVSSWLYSAIIRYTKDHAAEYTNAYDSEPCSMLASFDRRFLAVFKRLFPGSVTDLGPAKVMMGSPTIPVLVGCEAMLKVDMIKNQPLLRDLGRLAYIREY